MTVSTLSSSAQAIPAVAIPQLTGEIADPTSWHCEALQDLSGREKIEASAVLLERQENFECSFTEIEATGGGWGTETYNIEPQHAKDFFAFCFAKQYTLADLNDGIQYEHGTVSFACADLFGFDIPAHESISDEMISHIESLVEATPEAFRIMADGTVRYYNV